MTAIGTRKRGAFWGCATGPTPFAASDARRWHLHLGTLAHPSNPYDLHALDTVDGGLRLGESTAMAVGIYVVIDGEGRCRYIGKVTRQNPAGIRHRFDGHHAATPEWTAVWLLPLRDDCPDWLVRCIEAEMIGAWRPDGNVQHVPGRLRRARCAT